VVVSTELVVIHFVMVDIYNVRSAPASHGMASITRMPHWGRMPRFVEDHRRGQGIISGRDDAKPIKFSYFKVSRSAPPRSKVPVFSGLSALGSATTKPFPAKHGHSAGKQDGGQEYQQSRGIRPSEIVMASRAQDPLARARLARFITGGQRHHPPKKRLISTGCQAFE